MARRSTQDQIRLTGIEAAPSQVWGAIRIVPLLRRSARGDLRLARRVYRQDFTMVSIGGGPLEDPSLLYMGYIPNGLVVSWSNDGSAVAARGTHLCREDGRLLSAGPFTVRYAERMAKREQGNQLRFLPLELAMEGFMTLHFGGPDVAWSEYSRRVRSHGLSPRVEMVVPGRWIDGLEEALRVFEIHEEQVGVLLFVADVLAQAFVTPHPDDYRALHQALLQDFYGELLQVYGALHQETPEWETRVEAEKVRSLGDLRAELARVRADWDEFHRLMAGGLLLSAISSERVYRAGPFQLERFMTDLKPSGETYIGELIAREDGTIEYLKTYRLSAAQTRRAYLLSQLAKHNWNPDATAAALHTTRDDLILRVEKAGFGYLFHEHVVKTAAKRRRS